MALTRLDNLISSKTGKYLYVSPDDFNASDELNNRGNSPIRPFRSLQRAFIEISRFSYQPGPDNDRFDQFTVMVMPGKHYIDNRPGLLSADDIDSFSFDQALGEWNDNSILDLKDPNNVLYKFNNTEGGAIIPRGSSIIGYDLRRTIVRPLYVPDPADPLEKRTAIFNVTGGCYFWQFTIKDGDLEPSSPLYNGTDGIGKVYNQTPPAGSPSTAWTSLAVPNFSHHKLTVFEYADKEELGTYYQKIAKAFSQYQPTIDDANEFSDRIQETRIVGPLSDLRSIDSIKCTDSSPAGTITVEVTSKVNHGYFRNQFIAIENNGLDEQLDGTFSINSLDLVDKRKFTYQIPGTVAALGTTTNLVSGQVYTTTSSPSLSPNAVVKAEVDSVESASPYVFNCSIRSTWGICGIWANGLKATGFKSMVIAQYTGVSLQKDDRAFIRYDEYTNTFNQAALTDAFATVPYHTKGDAFFKDDWRNFHVRASEDSFIQCVSIFAVGFADHFLMESGGDMSITNSNSNFGNTSLHAIGHKGFAFNQDKGGYITDIVPPQIVPETSGNTKKVSYYTLDVQASNDQGNDTKIFLGDDQGYDPKDRPAATIDGYRIGSRSDEKIYVKLTPRTVGSDNVFNATLSPTGFEKFTITADVLNPSGVTVNNKDLDAADRIEENKSFIAYEAYGYITGKYPNLLIKEGITIEKCRRDIGYLIDATVQDLRLGGNINTIQAAESYFVASQLSYITGELSETLEGYDYARDLAIAATRNFTYLRTGTETTSGEALVNIGDTSGVVQGMTVADYDPSQFTSDNKLIGGATRPASPAIPDNTFVKRVVDSATIELGQKATSSEKKVFSDRHGDARNLLLSNKLFIAAEAFDRMVLDFPSYTSPTGYGPQDCRDDLVDIVEAIAENTGYGGNDDVWDAAYHYESGAVQYISQKKNETIRAIEYARDMSIQSMRNEDVFIFGSHGLTQTKDTSITYKTPDAVNDRAGDARALILANKQLISAESVERMLLQSSTAQYTPSNAVYTPSTGQLVLTLDSHSLTGASSHTASNAAYDAKTGVLTLTVTGNDFVNGDRIKIEDDSLTMTCTMGSGNKTYPRPSDPVSGKWLKVYNKQGDNFDVHVGKSPIVSFTPSAADYNPTTGLMTLTIGNHGLSAGTSVKLLGESLKFSCGFGGATGTAAEKSYPRTTDPFYDTAINIESVTTTTITLQVLSSQPSTNVDAHTFVSALAGAVITGGDYVHSYVTATGGGIKREVDALRLDYGAITFTCDMDENASEHPYPRVSDPAGSSLLPVASVSGNDITLDVGKTVSKSHDVSTATYDPATGDLVLSIDGHNLSNGQTIKLADGSLNFKCAQDSYQSVHSYPRTDIVTLSDATGADYNPNTGIVTVTITGHGLVDGDQIKLADGALIFKCQQDNLQTDHAYPRPSDPASDQWLNPYNITTNTFDIDILRGVTSTNTTVHQFSGAAPNGITKKKDFAWQNALKIKDIGSSYKTATDAAYDPATGILVVTSPSHGFVNGDSVKISENSLTFTCAFDSNATEHAYPRLSDPNSDKWLAVSNVSADQFTINVGAAGANQSFTAGSATTYDPASGDLVLEVGSGHGLSIGEGLLIENGAVSFKCTMDGNQVAQAYPRAGKDRASGRSIPITAIGSTTVTVNVGNAGDNKTFTPTAATYDAATGVFTATIGQHGLAVGSDITLKDNSLAFTCDRDGNTAVTKYPRPGTDPFAGKSISVTAVGSTTKTATGASYNPSTGALLISVAGHGYQNGDYIKIADNSLTFKCELDGKVQAKTYPRTGYDSASGRWLKISNVVTNAFEVNVGISQDTSVHEYQSATPDGIAHQDGTITFNVGYDSDANNQYAHTFVSADTLADAIEYEPQSPHTWDSSVTNGIKHLPQSAHSFKRAAASGIEKQGGSITVNVGVAAAGQQYTHEWTGGTAVGAVTSGGAYNHTWIESKTNGVHKVFSVAGNQAYHNQDCIDDVNDLLEAIADNVAFGGNDKTWDAAYSYKTGAHVAGEEVETNVVFDYAKEMAVQATRNQKILPIGSHGLTQVYDTTITNDTATPTVDANGDARALIVSNIDLIAEEAYARMLLQNPNFLPPTGNPQDCIDDIKDFITEVSYNLAYGGNDRTWDMANLYVTGAHVAGEEAQTLMAFTDAKELMIQAMRNEKILIIGSHGETQTYDNTISVSPSPALNNKVADAKSLIDSNKNFVAEIALGRMKAQYPAYTWTAPYTETDCLDDLKDVVDVVAHNLAYGGNDRVWDAALMYNAGAHAVGSENETIFAFNAVRDIIRQVIVNEAVTIGGHTGIAQVTDISITNGVANGDCDNAKATVTSLIQILTNAITSASSLYTVTREAATFRCVNAESTLNTLVSIVLNSITDPSSLSSVSRSRSTGVCHDVRSTIDTLFGIVTSTVTDGTALNSITRTISNGSCQNVASTITTLYDIITNGITTPGYLSTIDRTEPQLGIAFGPSVNANATTTNSYLYFTLTSGVYTAEFSPSVDDTITQDTGYPQCNDQGSAIRQYFANISTIIQTGLNAVPRVQPTSDTSALSSRSTLWKINGSNPHNLETGTVVRLVPRPRYDTNTNSYVDVDKRNVRLPNGFDTNEKYYVIAAGRNTKPENYNTASNFNGSATSGRYFMLANSKENAAAGIYIHSAEVEAIHPDIEIDLYQFVLDDKYDLHQYSCVLEGSTGVRTDVPHIFDVATSNTTTHEVFFRPNEGGAVPILGTNYNQNANFADTSTGRIRTDKLFFARYQNEKLFTIHATNTDAIANQDPIDFQSGTYDFSVFADKRQSPMRFDPSYPNPETTPVIYGKWYLNVEPNSNNAPANSSEILSRFHDVAYNDASGQDKTNDSWYERIKDERDAEERIYRLRYVIPQYLSAVRDPLNGFSIKVRKDETRKLLPQKLVLKPKTGVSSATFFNPVQTNEKIGFTETEFDPQNSLNLNKEAQYDPYKKDLVGSTQFVKKIETTNYVSMSIQSAKYINPGTTDEYLEVTVFDQGITNNALLNETLTTVKVTAPQGGSGPNGGFTVDKSQSTTANKIEWEGFNKGDKPAKGSAYLHAALQVPNTTTWHLILKDIKVDDSTPSAKLIYSETDNIRLSQGAVFADLESDPDFGKSLDTKDLIDKNLPQYYYKQKGAKVYTITPGDEITDDANVTYYVESVTDVGELNDTFYVFDVKQVQRRIFGQQDGIYYLTAVRGNVSPYPTGAGNQGNFRNFKFSQPISKLYPLNYKNDPLWYKKLDSTLVDPPATYSAADNYVHGLVQVNDFKGSLTKETVTDILATEALKHNTYTQVSSQVDNRIIAQKGNASSGSEDRLIPISGDNTVLSGYRMYVELRRPSIARAGNHTFEYLGFGPGNYSTGLPARQEVLLTPTQDFYAQSKKQDGGLVFYTGLNSNGDLYIGNRKIDAITGEEVFLERASLQDSEDSEDAIGSLVTTFDTPVTFNRYITVNGGDANDEDNTFNSPVKINVLGRVRKDALSIASFVSSNAADKDDSLLSRGAQTLNTQTSGDIVISRNRIAASVFQFNPRGSNGAAQGYKIQNHAVAGLGSNITPNQTAVWNAQGTGGTAVDTSQVVQYGNAGAPLAGDMLLKGFEVGYSGSLGWIHANFFAEVPANNIANFTFDGTKRITIQWGTTTDPNTNQAVQLKNSDVGVTSGSQIKISNYSDNSFNGSWYVDPNGFNSDDGTVTFEILTVKADVGGDNPRLWDTEYQANNAVSLMYSNSSWKEFGVVGSESIRTATATIGDYKVGINTVARAAHGDYANAFVSLATNPRANLDVVGTAWISGKTIGDFLGNTAYSTRTQTEQAHAFMVGGDSETAQNAATFRVSTTNSGRVGINTTLAEMASAFTVKGTAEITDNAIFQKDVAINGGAVDGVGNITTTKTTGKLAVFADNTFTGLVGTNTAQGGLELASYTQKISIGDLQSAKQIITAGILSTDSNISLGTTADGIGANVSKVAVGGAFASNESLSYTQIETKSLKIDGDAWLGFRRGFGDVTSLSSQSQTISFFSNSGGPSVINFATNASEVNIAGQGGTTKINNQLEVVASAKFLADIHLCGGTTSFEFTGNRAQMGSVLPSSSNGGNNFWKTGIENPYSDTNPDKNVDILNVLVKTSTDADYNEVNTEGTDPWGGSEYQNARTNVTPNLPALTGDEYYLPIRDADPNGYFAENDYIIINSGINASPLRHPEIVQIVELTSVTTSPFYLKVKRQPFGTFTTANENHLDLTPIFKVNVQFDSTWTETRLDNSGPQDNVDLAEFGGNLTTDDYVIIGRDPSNPSYGEVIKVDVLGTRIDQKLRVSDCGDPDTDVFVVNSVTGDTYIGGKLTIENSISINGGCESTKTVFDANGRETFLGSLTTSVGGKYITNINAADVALLKLGDVIKLSASSEGLPVKLVPDTKIIEIDDTQIKVSEFIIFNSNVTGVGFRAVRNEEFHITDGNGRSALHLDTCSGTLQVGNQRKRLDVERVTPSPQSAADTITAIGSIEEHLRVYSYWMDPKNANSGGPKTFLTSVAVTGTVPGSAYLTVDSLGVSDGAFVVGDLVLVGKKGDIDALGGSETGWNAPSGTDAPKWEFMKIESIDEGSKTLRCTPAQEGTVARSFTDYQAGTDITDINGALVIRFLKYEDSSQLVDAALRQRSVSGVAVDYASFILDKGYITQIKFDYLQFIRLHDTRAINNIDDQYFIATGLMEGTHHTTTMNEYSTSGQTGGGNTGTLKVNKNLEMIGGDVRIYDSVRSTTILGIANDDGHADHAGSITFNAGIVGRGILTIYPISCPESITSNCEEAFSVDSGRNVSAGSSLTILGDVTESPAANAKFSINRLGVNGANTYNINHDMSIDAFGIENFYGKSGGRHARYIATGADESDKYLTANVQYFANVSSGDTFVVYLPENPISGDTVNIIDVGGNLTYNTSLVIRAQGLATKVQGDSTGTTLGLAGSTPYASGEMIVQTPNAGLTLVYLGGTDSLGNSVGGSVSGWWLKEV